MLPLYLVIEHSRRISGTLIVAEEIKCMDTNQIVHLQTFASRSDAVEINHLHPDRRGAIRSAQEVDTLNESVIAHGVFHFAKYSEDR